MKKQGTESCIPLQESSICGVSVSQGRCSPDTRRKVYTAELLLEPSERIRLHSPLGPHLYEHKKNIKYKIYIVCVRVSLTVKKKACIRF